LAPIENRAVVAAVRRLDEHALESSRARVHRVLPAGARRARCCRRRARLVRASA
jgi:hypothetical protein